jgi:superfamily II DNA or RNA helicase
MLLESPTGSGKTLIVGRAIEGLRGTLSRKCAWFWFAPYTGLVAQTRVAEKAQLAFRFNDSIDPRLLKQPLIAELKRIAMKAGYRR